MMVKETDILVQSLLERKGLHELSIEELQGMTESFPYSSAFHFLYSKKLKTSNHFTYKEAVSHTALFFSQPLWLHYLLREDDAVPSLNQNPDVIGNSDWGEGISEHTIDIEKERGLKIEESSIIPIEPYHTVDYFASQGIKLSKEERKDDLSKKVQSFTAWLRTMKQLQPTLESAPYKNIEEIFGNKPEEKGQDKNEVYTETMAEVYLKQGMREKAVEIYQKLSLQNPANHLNFANKIKEIKAINA